MNPYPCMRRMRARTERGFSLLEALIAMLILAIGILGLVGLQTAMTRAQGTANLRADAVSIAGGVAGAMWADMANLSQYATANCSSYTPCSDWSAKAAALLPAGTVAVTVNSSNGDVSITVGWTTPGESHQYTLATTIVAKDKA